MMATAHVSHDCRVGVIIGTGTNACYMEKLSKCPKLKHLMKDKNDEVSFPCLFFAWETHFIKSLIKMVINIEWGAFGDNGVINFLLNKYDVEVDRMSINPGMQM